MAVINYSRCVSDVPTTVAIAAAAISLTLGYHEGVHGLVCLLTGGELQFFSALEVSCVPTGIFQHKLVAGSASVANLFLGVVCLWFFKRLGQVTHEGKFFVWLVMVENWLLGAGYWVVSGVVNIGDWAEVMAGWEPHWAWRLMMGVVGGSVYGYLVWLALKELGKIIGGKADEQIGRAVRLGLISYVTSVGVVGLAGLFNPGGVASVAVVAGLSAVLGGLSPLLWMMQWFRSPGFKKWPEQPLCISRKWRWIVCAVIVTFVYTVILGQTIYF